MGAKDWFICYADSDVSSLLAARPELDRAATDALVRRLFASHNVIPDEDGTLAEDANPVDDITNTRKISAVYLHGAQVNRSAPIN